MRDLIEALQIFLKYDDLQYPSHCEHDEFTVVVDPSVVSDEDMQRLEHLGFHPREHCFLSYRFGSC